MESDIVGGDVDVKVLTVNFRDGYFGPNMAVLTVLLLHCSDITKRTTKHCTYSDR